MPIYDYKCRQHGLFHALIAIDDAGMTQPCPTCQQDCARVVVIAPTLLTLSTQKRQAYAINEKAQHSPRLSSQQLLRADAKLGTYKTLTYVDGSKAMLVQRPWMISH